MPRWSDDALERESSVLAGRLLAETTRVCGRSEEGWSGPRGMKKAGRSYFGGGAEILRCPLLASQCSLTSSHLGRVFPPTWKSARPRHWHTQLFLRCSACRRELPSRRVEEVQTGEGELRGDDWQHHRGRELGTEGRRARYWCLCAPRPVDPKWRCGPEGDAYPLGDGYPTGAG